MFFRAKFSSTGQKFIYAIFGVQYHGDKPTGRQADFISMLGNLINKRAHFDRIIVPGKDGLNTHIWLSYWWPETYADWWNSTSVATFWKDLPDDAGIWREILTVSVGRTQNACTKELKNGVNGLGDMETFSEKIGYWGCLRDRLPESTPEEQFSSALAQIPERNPCSEAIRAGRTIITQLPDNICFLVEGQDHAQMVDEERTHWFNEFDELVTGWTHDLGANLKDNGLLDVRMGYVPEFGKFRTSGPINLDHNRKVELFYWLDMKKFERIGRVNRGHLKIRRKFMDDYCPVGKMGNGLGKICLWEETSVMKGHEIEAEYIGCQEGTGFMAYDKSGIIKSKVTTR